MFTADAFNDNKAGMAGLNKERIAKIIALSTSTNYENHTLKRKNRIQERVKRNAQILSSLNNEQLFEAEKQADLILASLESERNLSRIKVHIDMDAFFASVEMRDNPELRNIPMAVGGNSMLSTSNYIARRFGIRSAMPGFIARKLCPQLVIVRGNYEKYRKESAVFRSIFQQYDPCVRMSSLDEASLDITDFMKQRNKPVKLQRVRYDAKNGNGCLCYLPLLLTSNIIKDIPSVINNSTSSGINKQCFSNSYCDNLDIVNEKPTNCKKIEIFCKKCKKIRYSFVDYVEFGVEVEDVVNEIRFCVEQATGLTCSAGIGANWMLSKVCSDIRKPNGQFYLPNDRDKIIEFMRILPIRKVSGIGAVTEAILKSLKIELCGDIIEKRSIVHILFSDLQSNWYLAIALGIHSNFSDYSDVDGASREVSDRRSISIERTFPPQSNIGILIETCKQLSSDLISDCIQSKVEGGQTATLKIKFASFDVITRARTVNHLINQPEMLFFIIKALLIKEFDNHNAPSIRLLGVRLSRLKFVGGIGSIIQSTFSDTSKQKTITNFLNTHLQNRKELKSNTQIETVELSSSSDSNLSIISLNNLSNDNINESDLENKNLQSNNHKLSETTSVQVDNDIIFCENIEKVDDNIDDDCCIILDNNITSSNNNFQKNSLKNKNSKLNVAKNTINNSNNRINRTKLKDKTKKKQVKDLFGYFSLK